MKFTKNFPHFIKILVSQVRDPAPLSQCPPANPMLNSPSPWLTLKTLLFVEPRLFHPALPSSEDEQTDQSLHSEFATLVHKLM